MSLTEEQRAVAEAPVDARLLVSARPGTGKTHTLIARLRHLVEDGGLSPGQEVLTLSFSRAAVREIRNRLDCVGGDTVYVRATTFDSLATRLLYTYSAEELWLDKGYDGRINAAVALIRDNSDVRDELSSVRHLLVDEVQDVIGDRAKLVELLLGAVGGGFTLLGDPAQAIFDFQSGPGDARGRLYDWVRAQVPDVKELVLSENLRNHGGNAAVACWAGPKLAGASPDSGLILGQLIDTVARLPSIGGVALGRPLLEDPSQTAAILCRYNSQALLLSEQLWESDVDHRLQRNATDRAVAPWVAAALAGLEHSRVGKSVLVERLTKDWRGDRPEPEDAWRLLKRLDPGKPKELDLQRVAQRISSGYVPDELCDPGRPVLVVSTVHRAKGLEFDRVIIADPWRHDPGDEAVAEEARVLFVALTRSRRDYLRLPGPNISMMTRRPATGDRWVLRGPKPWMTFGFETRGNDAHHLDPAGRFVVEDTDPVSVQGRLRDIVRAGDPLTLERHRVAVDGGATRIFYRIQHSCGVVGITSEGFSALMYRLLRRGAGRVSFPARIEGVRVEGVDTVAGTEATSHGAGLGASGTWLRVRLSGVGKFVWEKGAP